MFSHGTLLLDSDLDEVTRALQVKMSKIQSKGHKSVRSRVANISEFLDESLDIESFRTIILKGLYEEREEFKTYHLTPEEWEEVRQLKVEKYEAWDWNYGRSPKFNIQRTRRFPIGEIDLRIFVNKGYIEEFKIFGDFFGKEPVSDIENKLIGARYDKLEIEALLADIDMRFYFGDLLKEDFINLVYGEDEE